MMMVKVHALEMMPKCVTKLRCHLGRKRGAYQDDRRGNGYDRECERAFDYILQPHV